MSSSEKETPMDSCLAMALSPDGNVVATGYSSGKIVLWNLQSENTLIDFKGHRESITCLLFTPDGKYLISGANDKRIIVWDPYKGEEIRTLKGHWGTITSLTINGSGTLLASASTDKKIKIWDMKKGWKKTKEFKEHLDVVSQVKFNPKNDTLISCSWDHTIKIWDVSSGKIILNLKGHFGPVYSIAITNDGKRMISGSSDGLLKYWNLENGMELQQLSTVSDGYTRVTIDPLNKYFAAGRNTGIISLWNLNELKQIKTITEFQETIMDILFSLRSDYLLALAAESEIQAWEISQLLTEKVKGPIAQFFSDIGKGKIKNVMKKFWEENIIEKKPITEAEDENIISERLENELPELLSVMKNGDEISLEEIKERYSANKYLAEKTLIKLLKERKIKGSYNPFKEILNINKGKPSEIIEVEDTLETQMDHHSTCFYCGNPINFNQLTCSQCNNEIAHCPICKLGINFDDEVGVCVFCGTKGHYSHMKESAKIYGECLICRKEINWESEIIAFTREADK